MRSGERASQNTAKRSAEPTSGERILCRFLTCSGPTGTVFALNLMTANVQNRALAPSDLGTQRHGYHCHQHSGVGTVLLRSPPGTDETKAKKDGRALRWALNCCAFSSLSMSIRCTRNSLTEVIAIAETSTISE